MTTGSYSTDTGSTGSTRLRVSKSWTGTDGKYTTFNGQNKVKFNTYAMTYQWYHQVKSRGHPGVNPDGSWGLIDYGIGWDSWTALDDTILEQKLVNNIREHEFNLAVAVAEGGKTVDMAVNAIRSISTAFLHAKHGNFQKAAAALSVEPRSKSFKGRDLSSRYLELQYGWQPLLNDVHEGAVFFAKKNNPPRSMVYSATRRKDFPIPASLRSTWPDIQGKRFLSKRLLAELTETLSTPRELGLLNPALVAWELVPYSFVLDWFIPIGTYLDNLSILPSLKGRFMRSEYLLVEQSAQRHAVWYYEGASASWKYLQVKRVTPTVLSATRPSFKSLPKVLSPTHIWNALALAHVRIS